MNRVIRTISLVSFVLVSAACLRINVHGTPDARALERLPGDMSRVLREAMPAVRFASASRSTSLANGLPLACTFKIFARPVMSGLVTGI